MVMEMGKALLLSSRLLLPVHDGVSKPVLFLLVSVWESVAV